MALKGGSTYPTDVKYGNTRVDEVKGKKADNTVVTQGTRPVYSFTDSNGLFDYWYNVTVGYNDGTHREAYADALTFYGDTLTGNYSSIDMYINAGANKLIKGSTNEERDGDGEFGGTSQDSGSLEVNKARLDNGTRSANSSMELGWTTAKGTPPQFPETTYYPIGLCTVNGAYAYKLGVYASAQGNNAITGDACLDIPAKVYATTTEEIMNYHYVFSFSDLAYNNLQPVAYQIPIDSDSYYFISLTGTVYLSNLKYKCSPSQKMSVQSYSIQGPTLSQNRPATTINVSTTNNLGYIGVSSFQFTCSRGAISSYLGLSNFNENNNYDGWDDFSFSAHPLDTGNCSLTLKSGWKCSSSKSGSFGVTTSSTGSITFNVQPVTYTLTVGTGTGVASTTTTITRGEAGIAAGATNVTNGTSGSYTVYYGDTYTCGGTASTGYSTPSTSSTATITTSKTHTVTTTAAPYTLTVSKGTGVASTKTTITRGTIGIAAGASNVSNGTNSSYTVYYGDKYTCGGTANTGYNTPSTSASATITGNKTHTVTTTAIAYTLTVSKGTGVASTKTSITRGTAGQHAGASNVSNGTNSSYTVYYGDTYTCGGTASTGYNTPSTSSSATITGNASYTVTTTATAYILTISKGTGVASTSTNITRGTIGHGAGNVSNGTAARYTVYYGDTYTCGGTASTGYNTPTTSSAATITGTKTHTVTTTAIAYTLTMSKGTGVASTKVSITRGTIGQAAGASGVSNGTAARYTVYYGDTITKYGGTAKPGYQPVAGAMTDITITGHKTISLTTSPYTRTLTAQMMLMTGGGIRTVQITRGSIATTAGAIDVNSSKTATSFGSYGTIPAESYTLYNGDSYSITFAPVASGSWSPEISGSILLTSASTDAITHSPQVLAKPTLTFAPTNVAVEYNHSSGYADVTPGVNASVNIPANNPTLYVKRTTALEIFSRNSSLIDDFAKTGADVTISTSTSAQTRSLSMYAGFSSGADLAETYEGFWSFDIQIVTGSGQVVTSVSLTGWSQARYNSQLD